MTNLYWLYVGLSAAGVVGGLYLWLSTRVRVWLSMLGMLMVALGIVVIGTIVLLVCFGGGGS